MLLLAVHKQIKNKLFHVFPRPFRFKFYDLTCQNTSDNLVTLAIYKLHIWRKLHQKYQTSVESRAQHRDTRANIKFMSLHVAEYITIPKLNWARSYTRKLGNKISNQDFLEKKKAELLTIRLVIQWWLTSREHWNKQAILFQCQNNNTRSKQYSDSDEAEFSITFFARQSDIQT